MLTALFGLIPLAVLAFLTWSLGKRDTTRPRAPWVGFVAGVVVTGLFFLLPDSDSSLWVAIVVSAIIVAAVVATAHGWAAAFLEVTVLATVVVFAQIVYALLPGGDGSGLDAVGAVLFWLTMFLPGVLLGAIVQVVRHTSMGSPSAGRS